MTQDSYLDKSLQTSEEGFRLQLNPETAGRFHSAWLSMMYPRLKLARNLLSDDGVFVVSIDFRESANLRRLCNEVFGEDNFIAEIAWEKMYTTKNDSSLISSCHESLLIFGREVTRESIGTLPRTAEMNARYSNPDNDPRGNWKAIPMYADGERKNGRFKIVGPTGRSFEPQPNSHWRYTESDVNKLIADNRVWFGKDGNAQPNLKRFLSELNGGVKAKSLWSHKEAGSNDSAKREIKELFGGKPVFSFPKPTKLIERIIDLAAQPKDSIILDFFAGSGVTAQAVASVNAKDGGSRRFVLVQIPEPCDPKSIAFQEGFDTIAELCKERVRRAGAKIKEDAGLQGVGLDIGFRVLKVDTSNMKDVYYNPDSLDKGDLFEQIENIKEDRTPEDLLFQVLLDWGVDLALPIAQEEIEGKTVFFVDENALVACFDKGVSEDLVKQLAARKPLRVVFRDAGFADDSVKINVEQIFKLMSPDTEVKAI